MIFIQMIESAPKYYVTWVVLICFSICLHEFFHAWTAYKKGDSTAVDGGYMTLNPLHVMGWQSLLILALFGLAWGAVPINPRRLRGKHGHLIVALAGPAANLGLAFLFFLVMFFNGTIIDSETILFVCRLGISANIFLLLFNLLPLPMLDGWELYSTLFPNFNKVPREQAQQYGFFGLLVILFLGLHRYLWDAADVVSNFAIQLTG